MSERKIKNIERWPKLRGKNNMLRHLHGERLTRDEAIEAKCYECCGGYEEGGYFCDIPDCPLSQYMPYKNKLFTRGCTPPDSN